MKTRMIREYTCSPWMRMTTGLLWDTHSILDTHRTQGVGFPHSQTKELTDDKTQEGVDLTR